MSLSIGGGSVLIRGGGGFGCEKGCGLARERFVALEQRAVTGIGIGEEHGVWQTRAQPVRIANRDHLVVDSVYDQHGLSDILQISETLAAESIPFAERCHLSLGDFRARSRLAILLALNEPFDEPRARGLTRL